MKNGTLGFGIGIDFNVGGLATHLVTISFDDGRKYQFKATGIRDNEDEDEDEPLTIYKVANGEKDYDTYVELTDDDSITICIDGEYTFADIIDSNFDEDNYDFDFECEENGVNIHVQCEYILGQDDQDLADIYRTSMFNIDENDKEDDLDEDNDYEMDDEEYNSFEDMYSDEIDRIDDAQRVLEDESEELIINAFEHISAQEYEITDVVYAVYWDGEAHRCVRIDRVYIKKEKKHKNKIYCSAVDELTDKIYDDVFSRFSIPPLDMTTIIHELAEEANEDF